MKGEHFIEYGYVSLNKFGEELCGDKVESVTTGGYTTVVLADGLGSGVKANILSTLSSKILCTMVSNNIPIEECIETLIQTLPVCKVRGVAYSTFSIIHVDGEGKGYLFEFDNPAAIYYHEGKSMDFDRNPLEFFGRKVYYSDLSLEDGDMVVLMSDGTIHAGIGKVLNFGWTRSEIKEHLTENITPDMSARCTAWLLAAACNDLYMDRPGDDTTVAVLKKRPVVRVNLMVGPPVNKDMDDFYVEKFLEGEGKKVVCGGTSSLIVARYLGTEVKTSLDYVDKDVPPIGYIKGVDLTTEGVITLRKLLELCEKYISPSDLTPKKFVKKDGASLLAELLLEEASHIKFFVGQSSNKAHEGLPIDTTMKLKLIDRLGANLKSIGKQVEIVYV